MLAMKSLIRLMCSARWVLVCALSGVVVGCSDRPDPGADTPIVITADDLRVLATSEGLSHVVDLEVLPDGRVWVFNSTAPFFVGFAPDGAPLGSHGVSGGGAREFRRPLGLVEGGIDGEAWVLDEIRRSLVRVSRPDEAWEEMSLNADSLPPTSLMGGDDGTFTRVRASRLASLVVLPRTTLSGDGSFPSMWRSMWGADLVSVDPSAGGTTRTVVPLGTVLGDPLVDSGFDMSIPPFPIWFRLWATCGDREIVVYDRLRNQLRGFSPTGREFPAWDLPDPAFNELSRDEFAQAVLDVAAFEAAGSIELEPPAVDTAALLPAIYARMRGNDRELAAVLPRYTDLRCSDDNVIWMRRFDPIDGGLRGSTTWLRVTGNGSWREVTFPERFDPRRFRAGRAWGVLRDTYDVASIAWVEF